MGSDHFLNLQPGTIVNGRYEVVKCLGTGSMGMVYACRHRELAGHIVAMKVLFSEVARDEVAAARFRNEIVASYGVSHPHVVRAYEYFRDGDLIAFTMEYIGGGDLADKISVEDKIPIPETIRMLQQMCSGVQAIHDAGIIHRDLKPENILITAQGDIKITDFGIARTGTGPKLTEHGGVVGTIDYVSPEYLEQGQVDQRSDIYALGVLAYEMLTQESPFKGKSVIETMTMRLRSDAEPPHHLRPECPIALSNIVLKAMARDPETRYQAAREILDDLNALAQATNGQVVANQPFLGTSGVHSSLPNSSATASGAHPSVTGSSGARERPHIPLAPPSSPRRGGYEESPPATGGYVGYMGAGPGDMPRPSINTEFGSATYGSGDFMSQGYDNGFSGYDAPQMESVLINTRVSEWSRHLPNSQDQSPPSVAISQSKLSTNRIQELSWSQTDDPEGGVLSTIFHWLLVFFLGFGVGWFLFRQFKPELFGPVPTEEAAGDTAASG